MHTQACKTHDLDLMSLLVEQSIDLSLFTKDRCGNAPLHAAAASDQVDAVKYILQLCDPLTQISRSACMARLDTFELPRGTTDR